MRKHQVKESPFFSWSLLAAPTSSPVWSQPPAPTGTTLVQEEGSPLPPAALPLCSFVPGSPRPPGEGTGSQGSHSGEHNSKQADGETESGS